MKYKNICLHCLRNKNSFYWDCSCVGGYFSEVENVICVIEFHNCILWGNLKQAKIPWTLHLKTKYSRFTLWTPAAFATLQPAAKLDFNSKFEMLQIKV